jgi:hypothetical protein
MKNQVFFAKLFLYLTILLAGIGCTNTSDTPENTINGTVQDSNGNGISTVTITSNTGVTTTTDSDGNYSIETDRSGTLTYTKEDFISNKVDINFSKLLNITLQTDLFSTSYFATANNTIADPNFRTSSLQPSSNITATTIVGIPPQLIKVPLTLMVHLGMMVGPTLVKY